MILKDDRTRRPSEILELYAAGERDFSRCEIEQNWEEDPVGFSGADLRGANFSGCFILADFMHADLRRAVFHGTNVKTCSFDYADLRDADFRDTALESTSWVGAELTGCRFEGAGCYSYTFGPDDLPI